MFPLLPQPENCPLSSHPGAHQLSGCRSGVSRRGGARGPAPSPPAWGEVVTPFPGARQSPRPWRACAPPRATQAQGPRPKELPKRLGGSSPGTLPLWGASFSPPPGPTPAAPRTPATQGQISATCSRAGAPGHRPPHGAAGQQRQLRERCVRPARTPCALRFAFPPCCSFSLRPLLPGGPKRGRGSACVAPHPVLRHVLGRSRVLADFPPLWSWVAGGGAGNGRKGGVRGREEAGFIDWSGSTKRWGGAGGVSFMYSCFRF